MTNTTTATRVTVPGAKALSLGEQMAATMPAPKKLERETCRTCEGEGEVNASGMAYVEVLQVCPECEGGLLEPLYFQTDKRTGQAHVWISEFHFGNGDTALCGHDADDEHLRDTKSSEPTCHRCDLLERAGR